MSGPIRAALVDISGAVAACQKLFQYQRNHNLKVLFLTNTSKMSLKSLLQQLRDMGFEESAIPVTNKDDGDGDSAIMTSVGATRRYLIQNDLRPYCLVEDELLKTDFNGIVQDDPNCVLVGLAPSKFHYEKLNEAFRLLHKWKEEDKHTIQAEGDSVDNHGNGKKPRLIAIHRGTHYRDSDHQLSLGPGGFVSLLEQTAAVTHTRVIGKPSREFYNAALSVVGVTNPAHVVMVGDDVVGDVKGALDAGLGRALLVKTGKYVHGDELGRKTEGVLPTLTVDSIVEAVDHICSTFDGL